uniref:Gem nuclear organelle associated protein 2 n=1 Tax=Molossus molossus TaxID=27622 RepID=A0A7J8JV65_MOLMO|nr:gem nuclear organelle associated protein 2 [Molossus molossus]
MAWVPAESAVEELMPRLLPVEPCDLTEGFDPSIPPRTPQEYLRRVQIEAAQCPDVVVAQIDPKKLKRKQSVNISLSGCQPAPEGYSPTLQWQQQQVAQFSTVRQSVNRHRSHWKSQQLDSNVTMVCKFKFYSVSLFKIVHVYFQSLKIHLLSPYYFLLFFIYP